MAAMVAPPDRLRTTWGATLTLLAGQVLFAVVMWLIGARVGALTPVALVLIGVVLALVPALLWLTVFYLQDRLEPEPKHFVVSVFALGALLAGAVGEPLLRDAYRLNEWGSGNLAAEILVRGALEAALIYIAVRASVYMTHEFDERIDGIIYGTAAGLGVATMVNFNYVLDNGGVDIGVGAVRIVIASLALASVGGVVGYGLSQARFNAGRSLALPGAVVLAAVLDGAYNWAQTALIRRGGLDYTPWYGLVGGVVFAVAVLGLLYTLMQRSVQEQAAR